MCREAAIIPVREYIKENYNYKSGKLSRDDNDNLPVRPLRTSDFVKTADSIPSVAVD